MDGRFDGFADCLNDPRIRVAKHEWTERADVIDVAVAVSVPDERSLAPHHDRRFAADCPICSDWTVDSAWEELGGSVAPGGAVAAPGHVTSNRDVSVAMNLRWGPWMRGLTCCWWAASRVVLACHRRAT